jgi:hypothetical protein
MSAADRKTIPVSSAFLTTHLVTWSWPKPPTNLFLADPAFSEMDYVSSMEAAGVPFDRLDAAEIMGRWPQFRLR